MKNKIKYKDFIGTVEYADEDKVFYGKIEGINDLVTFEGDSVELLNNSFKEAVEDYLELCKTLGKKAHKSFKGSFNIRIESDLHRQAFLAAKIKGISLNQFVQLAIQNELKKSNVLL